MYLLDHITLFAFFFSSVAQEIVKVLGVPYLDPN